LVNLKNISKVEVKQYIIINFFLVFISQGCNKIIQKNQLVFKDCEIYSNNQIFTGEYELNRGDKYVLGKVLKGKLENEKTFKDEILLMEKDFDSCMSGFQRVFNLDGKKKSEGSFLNGKRSGKWKYFTKDSVYFVLY